MTMPPNPSSTSRLLATCVVATSCFGAEAAPSLEGLRSEHDGSYHEATCGSAEWPNLARALREASAGRRQEQLVDLVRTYLCGRGRQADLVVRRHAASRLASRLQSTGQDDVSSTVDKATLTAQLGRAWMASAIADGERVALSFASSAACMRGATFRFGGTGWRIEAVSEACD